MWLSRRCGCRVDADVARTTAVIVAALQPISFAAAWVSTLGSRARVDRARSTVLWAVLTEVVASRACVDHVTYSTFYTDHVGGKLNVLHQLLSSDFDVEGDLNSLRAPDTL